MEYMRNDTDYARFFAYMNLFVGAMVVLVLAGNLPMLYLGWEGVGLCSYLLIGFWYDDPANARAAVKAFIVTRIGDIGMLIGLFVLYYSLGTLDLQPLMERAQTQWTPNSAVAVAATALLLCGALGKSGQLPLQVWLPDAMAGPTPVSALIHAATMVAAGVYLLARTHVLFDLAPAVQFAVALIGAATLLLAGTSALAQRDIKRALAYSTISQLGYMFLALGVGAWSAALFHFMTHAFFKALLFMAAGAVILALHHEQDMFNMGGLRRRLPLVFWTFLAGAMSLAALPLVTAGFYSKDMILWSVLSSPKGGVLLWAAGAVGAFLTGLYSFRIVFLVFFGEEKGHVSAKPGPAMMTPLVILAVLALTAGFVEMPTTLGHVTLFSDFMGGHTAEGTVLLGEGTQQVLAGLLACGGAALAPVLFLLRPEIVQGWVASPFGGALHRLCAAGWGFDWVYDRLVVRPVVGLASLCREDFMAVVWRVVGASAEGGAAALGLAQTGRLRFYMAGIAFGAIIVLALVVLL
jgi:NADH-quinone oxidoreductase subunit L